MIYTENVFAIDPTQYDEVWIICRKVDELAEFIERYDNVYHVPALSPSPELFRWYRNEYHNDKWNEENFQTNYAPWFLADLKMNQEAQTLLKKLKEESTYKNIVLACFCENENMCHRSLVKQILSSMEALIL